MTFAEFLATKTEYKSLGHIFSDSFLSEVSGFTYADGYYIENNPPEFEGPKYHLTLERDEWLSDDLGELEARLFIFAKDSGGLED